jgi:hypothetical protein
MPLHIIIGSKLCITSSVEEVNITQAGRYCIMHRQCRVPYTHIATIHKCKWEALLRCKLHPAVSTPHFPHLCSLYFMSQIPQIKLSNISVSLRHGWGKSYLLSCLSIIHKMFNKCVLFIKCMESVLWHEEQKQRFWLKWLFMVPLGMFCLLFLTASLIENTQIYHKIVLEGVKFQISLKLSRFYFLQRT